MDSRIRGRLCWRVQSPRGTCMRSDKLSHFRSCFACISVIYFIKAHSQGGDSVRFHRKTIWIWWLSYMAVVLTCLCAMLALYSRTANTVQQSLQSTSRERAQSFAQLADRAMDEMQSAANSVQLDSHMAALSPSQAGQKTPETIEHIRCLQQTMLTQISERDTLLAAFVWFPQADMLLSTIANWRGELCARGMEDFGLSPDELSGWAGTEETEHWLPTSSGGLLYLRRINSRDGYRVIGILADTARILPEDIGFLETDLLLLQLDQGALVWHGDESRWPGLAEQVFAAERDILTLYPDSDAALAGVRGVYTRSGYEIACLTPQAALYGPLAALRWMYAILCAVFLLVGVAMAYLFSRLQYRPVRRVADLVLSRAEGTVEADVFRSIEHRIRDYLQELEQKNALLRTASQREEQHMLMHLITGWGTGLSPRFLQDNQIRLAQSHYAMICNLQTRHMPQGESSLSIQAALSALQQLLQEHGLLHTLHLPEETLFLLDAERTDALRLTEPLEELATALEDSLHTVVRIGLSRPQPGVSGLPLAAQEAMAALYTAVREDRCLRQFQPLDPAASVDRLFFSRLAVIYDLTQSGNYQGALDLAEELSRQPGFGALQSVALAINSAAMTVRLETPEQEAALRELLEPPGRLSRPEELQEYAGRIFGQLAVSRPPEHSAQEEQVLQYFQQNFADPQLSVAEIARQLSLSQSTLSRLTMRLVSLTPLDYIQQLRMERAKELLRQGCSVSEAAEQVGCTNAAALRRIFRKFEDSTPAHYMP